MFEVLCYVFCVRDNRSFHVNIVQSI